MKAIEVLDMLKNRADEFRADRGYWHRNRHMHAGLTSIPLPEHTDAVLCAFINHVAAVWGIDYCLRAEDLCAPTEQPGEAKA